MKRVQIRRRIVAAAAQGSPATRSTRRTSRDASRKLRGLALRTERRQRLDEADERKLRCVIKIRVTRTHDRPHGSHDALGDLLEQLARRPCVAGCGRARQLSRRIGSGQDGTDGVVRKDEGCERAGFGHRARSEVIVACAIAKGS